jgi:hypothetical protein
VSTLCNLSAPPQNATKRHTNVRARGQSRETDSTACRNACAPVRACPQEMMMGTNAGRHSKPRDGLKQMRACLNERSFDFPKPEIRR